SHKVQPEPPSMTTSRSAGRPNSPLEIPAGNTARARSDGLVIGSGMLRDAGVRRTAFDAHRGDRGGDGRDHAAHHKLVELTDASDAEAVGNRELARIDDKAARLDLVIEALEGKARIRGGEECGDDRRQPGVVEQGAEAQLAHAGNEDVAVAGVAGKPA